MILFLYCLIFREFSNFVLISRRTLCGVTGLQLYPVWKSKDISVQTKLRIFRSNVKSVLLYGCETWKDTKSISGGLQVFLNRCLRRILKIYWPNTISNDALLRRTEEEPIEIQIKRRKWGWIGHSLRKKDSIEKEALKWNPQGCRRRGRPRASWRRTVEEELRGIGKSWADASELAQNRDKWRKIVVALCSSGKYRK